MLRTDAFKLFRTTNVNGTNVSSDTSFVISILLKKHRQQTANETVDEDDYLFRQPNGKPMNPCTFTYRFKLILKANNLPLDLNVHSLRHPYVKPTTKKFITFFEVFRAAS